MVTVTGTFLRPDDTPCTGAVTFAVYVAASDTTPDDRVVTPAPVVVRLDDTGSFTVDLVASDDDGWQTDGPMPYTIGINVTGQRAYNYAAYINDPGPHDIGELVVLDWPPNVANIPTDGPQGPQGEAALIVGSFTRDPAELPPDGFLPADWDSPGKPANDLQCLLGYAIIHYPSGHLWSFVGPEKYAPGWVDSGKVTGPQGDKGDKGDAATVDVGTTTTGDAGTDAAVVNSGSTSAAVFDFTIPKGDQGDKGDQGEVTQAELEAYAAARATVGNLLTDNQASGTDTLETTAGFAVVRGALARSTAWAANGSGSVRLTASEDNPAVYASDYIATEPGRVHTFLATVKENAVAVSGLTVRYGVVWRTASGSQIGGIDVTEFTAAADAVAMSHTAVAPATAARAVFYFTISAATNGDTYDLDNFSVHVGAGGNWAMPGTPITGLGTRITRPNIDDRLIEQYNPAANSGAGGWSVVDYDSGLRDVRGLLANGWAIGRFTIQRKGGYVILDMSLIDATAATTNDVATLPSGFKIAAPQHLGWAGLSTGTPTATASRSSVIITGAGDLLQMLSTMAGAGNTGLYVYPTTDPIPTSLPGVLVTPAPQ